MANIDGGALSFKSQLDNSQLNAAIDETLRRIKGLSDGTVSAGSTVDSTFSDMANDIRTTLSQIGDACASHESALAELESKYEELGHAASDAFMSGRDDEYRAIEEQRAAIQGEIKVRKELLTELRNQSNELENAASKMEQGTSATNRFGESNVSIRTQLRNMREELIAMEMAGKRNTDEYRKMQEELGRLTDAYSDATQQANIMAHDQRGLQGVISGLSGMSGAVSAATGALSLFAGENENLQKVMTKIQSVMAITIGLQQVEQTLNKDSAFRLVTLNGLKAWWNKVVTQSGVALTAETAAMGANAAATTGATVATTAATAANVGLAGAIKLVGTAIKSIPVFGWILAGVSALVAVVASVTSRTKEAKKAQEEFSKATIENCYKTIGVVEQLSTEWKTLGDDFQSKQTYIDQNRSKFDELGVSIKGVTDAENLLVKNKDKFIAAEIAKAKAIAMRSAAQDKIKTLLEKQSEYDAMPDTVTKFTPGGSFGGSFAYETDNTKKKKKKEEIDALNAEITKMFTDAANFESEGWNMLSNAGIDGADTYAAGTVGAIEQAISAKQEALKNATSSAEYKAIESDIDKLNNQLNRITGGGGGGGKGGDKGDPFIAMLRDRKSEYDRFLKWMNSGDEILAKSASTEFAGLLAEGANYMEFLKNQRDSILSVDESERTAEQIANLTTLNNAIAEETRQTVIDSFNAQLNDQLAQANSTLEMLNVIAEKRKELANDDTDLDNAKSESLDDAEKAVNAQIEKERAAKVAQAEKERQENEKLYADMLVTYQSFEEKRAAINKEYDDKIALATEKGNTELIARLNEAREKALSSMAVTEMQSSPAWDKMFGNLDELTTKELQNILDQFDGVTAYMGIEFDPKDLATLKEKIQSVKDEIEERNPFKSLMNAIKDYNKATDDTAKKKSASQIFSSLSSVSDLVGGAFDAVVKGLQQFGVEMDETDQKVLNDISTAVSGAADLAMGIATGNPMSIIQGSISLITAGIDLFDSKTRQSERRIAEYKERVDELSTAYNNLQHAISNALGGSVYTMQKQAIQNLETQLDLVKKMQKEEESQKKTDKDAVKEYKAQQEEIKQEIEDLYRQIAEDMLQTNATQFADELSSALVDAFRSGEDAAQAFEETVNNVLRNIVVNQLKKQFLENQLQGAMDDLQGAMGYWVGDTFVFDGLTPDEVAAFKSRLSAATSNFTTAYEMYSDMFSDIFGADADDKGGASSLTGAVKGVTEETASIISGQMNAMRINQIEGNGIMRDQLMRLTQIAANTTYLARIYSTVQSMQSALENNNRSQGLS